jgi:hypothetical protein
MLSFGATEMVTDVQLIRTPHARGWRFTFGREPGWHFPLTLDRLVRASLARPFAAPGASYALVVTDSIGPLTVLERRGSVTVEESLIVHWVGRAMASLTRPFSGAAIAESNAFLASVFAAVRADLQRQIAS